jgi:hypothetical protein
VILFRAGEASCIEEKIVGFHIVVIKHAQAPRGYSGDTIQIIVTSLSSLNFF